MKSNPGNKIFALALICITTMFLSAHTYQKKFTGAYEAAMGSQREAIIFQDGYFMHTSYDLENKKFGYSQGGTFEQNGNNLVLNLEFSTRSADEVGTKQNWPIKQSGNTLIVNRPEAGVEFKKVDDGNTALAGNWRITGRKEGEQMTRMQNRGARKTLKLLSGTRFQWAAINPETKEFFGTGGGTYTFQNGKYTETIEFFSRDNTRVGASLSFNGEVKDGEWHHSGLSSKGDPIYEIWSREK